MSVHADDEVTVAAIKIAEMAQALDDGASRFVDLLRRLDDSDGGRPVPTMTWTVAETAAHMLAILRRGTGDSRRATSLAGLAEMNDLNLAEIETRSLRELADLIAAEASRLGKILGRFDQEQAVGFVVDLHAGVRADLPSALSYIVCDLMAHGVDIAQATGLSIEVDPAHAALDMHAILPLLTPWVVDDALAGPAQGLAVTFPGDGVASVVSVGEGSYRAERVERSAVPGAHEVDPVEAFLAVCRRGPAIDPAVATLAGWYQPI